MSEPTDVEGTLFFAVGGALWKSDATPAGTVRVRDFPPDEAGGGPRDLVEARGLLFFVHGRTLWRSDGTEAGTFALVTSSMPGFDPDPRPLREYRGRLLFSMYSPGVGGELWSSDGTRAGTRLLRDVNPGPLSSHIGESVVTASGDFVFGARLGEDGEDITLLKLTPAGALVELFRIRASETSIFTLELWVSDGTPEGTSLFADVRPGDAGSIPTGLTVFEDLLYFSADDGVHGRELWATDGTEGGTRLVKDIRPGAAGSDPYGLGSANRKLYFVADDGVHGAEPWKVYQGRARIVADVLPGSGGSAPRRLGFDPEEDDVFFRSGGYVFFATGEDASALWAMKTGSYCPVP